jgi:plasmid stabilization system protein ParE
VTIRLVEFHRLATADYVRARRRYFRERGAVREQQFVDDVEAATERIATAAESCSPFDDQFRWVMTKDFPYLLFFYIWDDTRVTVYGVRHKNQRPGTWRRRFTRP